MANLHGARVGLLESRLSTELSELVRRLGGTPVAAPSVREIPNPAETTAFVEALLTRRFSVVVFLTGAAAKAVWREADAQHRPHHPARLYDLGDAALHHVHRDGEADL